MMMAGVRTNQRASQRYSLPQSISEERAPSTIQDKLNQLNPRLRAGDGIVDRTNCLRQGEIESLLCPIASSGVLEVRRAWKSTSTNHAGERNRVHVRAKTGWLRGGLNGEQECE